ncbi:MAG: MerR family transcriptional regulator [Chlamydiales bacterium]|nr:MerR family transcriptional regulator [Chlamydiales bacterium]
MAYTVAKLAKISGVSVRTLHWYDKIGLLRPAYHGANGYRYYEEEQLLILQQILFFRELEFDLKQIELILKRSDFDKTAALNSHREVLQKNVVRTKQLIKTIDKTIEHLNGTKKMKDHEIYNGFTEEKQREYQQYLINRFGQEAKASNEETFVNFKNLSKKDFEKSKEDWDAICKELIKQWKGQATAGSAEVQRIVRRHYEWIKGFWTPDRISYANLGEQYIGWEWKEAFQPHDPEHPKLARFLAEGMVIFAEKELS